MKSTFYLMPLLLSLAGCSTPESDSETPTGSNGTLAGTDTVTENLDSGSTLPNSEFEWNDEGFRTEFHVSAYVDDPDTKSPTNVRNFPDGEIVLKLPQDDSYMLTIISQHNGWFEVSDIVAFESNPEIPEDEALWMHPSVLTADTRNYGGEKIPVYQYPEENEAYITAHIEGETRVRFREFYFDFAHIRCEAADGSAIDGWIHSDWLCGNPVTTCP